MATYYISPTGNDTTGDGTHVLPWLTIVKANTESIDGDTIIFQDGTYTWSNVNYRTLLTRTYEAENKHKAILDGGYAQMKTDASAADPLIVRGIVFQNSYHMAAETNFMLNNGRKEFYDCEFRNMSGRPNAGHPVYTIIGQQGLQTACSYYFKRCLFYNMFGVSGTVIATRLRAFNVLLEECTMVFYKTTGKMTSIFGFSECGPTTLKNCIIANYTEYDLYLGQNNDNRYNVIANSTCLYNLTNYPVTLGTGSFIGDPYIVSPADGDLSLEPDSPCRRAGL